MKALIISFFCIILCYSFLFDEKKEVKSSPVMDSSEIKDVDIEVARNIYYSDTLEYFAQKKNNYYMDGTTDITGVFF